MAKKNTGLLIGAGVAVLGAAGLGYYLYSQHQAQVATAGLGAFAPARGYNFTYTPASSGVCANAEDSIQRVLAQMVGLSHALAASCGPHAALELQRRFASL